jgi:hypothetical protein
MSAQDTVARTTPIAMHAVAKHGLDHRLPAPQAIRRPKVGGRAVRVTLFADDLEPWIHATSADYLSPATIGAHGRSVVVRFTGRVPSPIGDVQVELQIVQRIADAPARPLTLIPGGAA